MPTVGNKHFSYDAKGMKEAREASKRSGKKMTVGYDEGGMVETYQDQVKRKCS
tara:strand:+ start:1110 stop:1268 length:159 start_codon:yes stop_codon:yes gene_type:complete